MLIRLRQIEVEDFKEIFIEKKDFKVLASQVVETDQQKFVSVGQIQEWSDKAEKNHMHLASDIRDLHTVATTGDADTLNGRTVNDERTSTTSLWTSNKISSELSKAETNINDRINSISNILDDKAETSDLLLLQASLDTYATKSSVSCLEIAMKDLATKTSVEELNTKVNTKVSNDDFNSLVDIVASKADLSVVENIGNEVIAGRKGHISLLDKINEIDDRLDALTQLISHNSKAMPIGGIAWFTGENIPEGYAKCNGEAIDRDSYPDLFNIISTTYGEGDGVTTFNIPNLINDEIFVRSSGNTLRVGARQSENLTDVRESYEGLTNTDKLYLVGGKWFNDEVTHDLDPNNITFTPCIKLKETKSNDTPIGMFNWFTSNELPPEYILCDGRELSREKYKDLFTIIGTLYGEGDGSKTFNVPDLTSGNRFVKASNNLGLIYESNLKLTDVREAYEGENNSDKFYPLGGSYFSDDVTDSELIPPSVALVPAIKAIKSITNMGAYIGSFEWFSMPTAPAGYLVCDGRAVSRLDYEELFKVVGTTFGKGDGVSTFNLPDLISLNKSVRACGGNIPLGFTSDLNLIDIRSAYEGNNGSDKLFPIGAKYFENENLFTSLHPSSIALLPCIKAKDVDTLSLSDISRAMETISYQLENISSVPETANYYEPSEQVKINTFSATLKNGRQNVTINNTELGVDKVNSAFVNISATTSGDEYVCDIISNVVIKSDCVIVYFKSLDQKLNNDTIKATIHIL